MSVQMLNIGFENIADNIGMSFEVTIFVVVLMGGIIFIAKDFKIGMALQFFIQGLLFLWFYDQGFNYVPPLVVMLITLVILSFTLYATAKQGEKGAIV